MVDHLVGSDINARRIGHIENCFGISGVPLSIPGRVLVGEGILTKICRKKPKARQFFLFNDILVYGDIIMKKKKYVGQHIILLEEVTIDDIPDRIDENTPDETENGRLKHGWQIKTPNKSFTVYAANKTEKQEWITHIDKCVNDLLKRTGKKPTNIHAAVWVPDTETDVCMHCRVNYFSFINRRHHCRYCGLVICGDCSKNKFLIPSQSSKPVRVCDSCHNILAKQRLGLASVRETMTGQIKVREPLPLPPEIQPEDTSSTPSASESHLDEVRSKAIIQRNTLVRMDSFSSDEESADELSEDPLTKLDDYLEDEKPTFYNDGDEKENKRLDNS
ncbi:pleckstrin homology domain-containing family F member 2-like [Panonychus citri]|uniref:pleckstrin homology domain-containing family F member 2-like n=1 Tax=Panonychus citri TaxID=50023 RepID=UPI002306E330|nr:pleckstrin homology domain-containing family F member 2-like [Panonychus citri]